MPLAVCGAAPKLKPALIGGSVTGLEISMKPTNERQDFPSGFGFIGVELGCVACACVRVRVCACVRACVRAGGDHLFADRLPLAVDRPSDPPG